MEKYEDIKNIFIKIYNTKEEIKVYLIKSHFLQSYLFKTWLITKYLYTLTSNKTKWNFQ